MTLQDQVQIAQNIAESYRQQLLAMTKLYKDVADKESTLMQKCSGLETELHTILKSRDELAYTLAESDRKIRSLAEQNSELALKLDIMKIDRDKLLERVQHND